MTSTQMQLIARQVSSRVRDLHAAAEPAFNAAQFARTLAEDEKAAIVRDWLAEHARCAAWAHSGSNRSLASNFYVFVRDAEGTPRVRDSWPALGEEQLTTPPGLEFFCLHKHASRSPRHRIGRADHYCVVLTDEVGRATYAHCAHHIEETGLKKEDVVLCFVSQLPLFTLFEDILDTLLTLHTRIDWRSSRVAALGTAAAHVSSFIASPRAEPELIAEQYVHFIVGDMRVPRPAWRIRIVDGRERARSVRVDAQLHIETPPLMCLPAVDPRCFAELFKYLSLGNVVHVVTTLMQEHSVLFVAAERGPLAKVAAALRALIWPLDWPHAFSPVLPHHRLGILEAPMPFVAGTTLSNLVHPAKGGARKKAGEGAASTVFDVIDKRSFTVVWLDANVVIGPPPPALTGRARRGPTVGELPFLLRSRLLRKLRAAVPTPVGSDPARFGLWRRGGKATQLRQSKRKNKVYRTASRGDSAPRVEQANGELAFNNGDVLELIDEGRPGLEPVAAKAVRKLGSAVSVLESADAWSLCRLRRCVGWVRSAQLRKVSVPEAAAVAAAAKSAVGRGTQLCDVLFVEPLHPRKRLKVCAREIRKAQTVSASRLPLYCTSCESFSHFDSLPPNICCSFLQQLDSRDKDARDRAVKALREEKRLLADEQRVSHDVSVAAPVPSGAESSSARGSEARDAPSAPLPTPWHDEVRAAFLEVQVAVLGSYRRGMPTSHDGPAGVIEFDVDAFAAGLPAEISDQESQLLARSVIETQLAMLFMMEADSEAHARFAAAARDGGGYGSDRVDGDGSDAAAAAGTAPEHWISTTGPEGVMLFDRFIKYCRGEELDAPPAQTPTASARPRAGAVDTQAQGTAVESASADAKGASSRRAEKRSATMRMQTLIMGLSDAERLAMMQRLAAGSLNVHDAVSEMETTSPVGTNALYAGGKGEAAAAVRASARVTPSKRSASSSGSGGGDSVAENGSTEGAAETSEAAAASAKASTMSVALSPLRAVTDHSIRRALDSSAWEMGSHSVSVHTAEGVPSAVGGEARRARLAAALRVWRSGAAARRSDLAEQYQDSAFFAPLIPSLFGRSAFDSNAYGEETPLAAAEEGEKEGGSDSDGDAAVAAAAEVDVQPRGQGDSEAAAPVEAGPISAAAPGTGRKSSRGGSVGNDDGSLPLGWSEHLNEAGLPYYHNMLERRTTWTRPRGAAAAAAAAAAATAGDGAASASSGAADVKPPLNAPLAAGWEAFVTEEGMPYYYNALVRKTTWLKPTTRLQQLSGAGEAGGGEFYLYFLLLHIFRATPAHNDSTRSPHIFGTTKQRAQMRRARQVPTTTTTTTTEGMNWTAASRRKRAHRIGRPTATATATGGVAMPSNGATARCRISTLFSREATALIPPKAPLRARAAMVRRRRETLRARRGEHRRETASRPAPRASRRCSPCRALCGVRCDGGRAS